MSAFRRTFFMELSWNNHAIPVYYTPNVVECQGNKLSVTHWR